MQIELRYIGMIAEKLKRTEDAFELQSPFTIKELLQFLTKTYRIEGKNPFYLSYKNQIELSIFVMKNKKLASLNERIADKDKIMILPIIAGG